MRRRSLRNHERRRLRRRGRRTERLRHEGRRCPGHRHPRQRRSRQRVLRLRKDDLLGHGALRAPMLRRRSSSLPARARRRRLPARNHPPADVRLRRAWMHAGSVHATAPVLRTERPHHVRPAAARHARCDLPLRLTYFRSVEVREGDARRVLARLSAGPAVMSRRAGFVHHEDDRSRAEP